MLTKAQKTRIREITRKHWIATNGRPEETRELTMAEIRSAPRSIIGAILLAIVAKIIAELVWALIQNWLMKKPSTGKDFHVPAPEYTLGEPGYTD